MSIVNLAVLGCRQFDDYAHFEQTLAKAIIAIESLGESVQKIITIKNSGVNAMVIDYCKAKQLQIEVIEVDWELLGKSAAFQTNDLIISKSTHLVCLTDRVDKVVEDAINKGLKARRSVKIFKVAPSQKSYKGDGDVQASV